MKRTCTMLAALMLTESNFVDAKEPTKLDETSFYDLVVDKENKIV